MIPDTLDWLYICAAALGMAGAIFLFRRLWKRDPKQAERRRRERLGRIGRLGQCEIMDILEWEAAAPAETSRSWLGLSISPNEPLPGQALAVYRYTISGVSYETTQDVPEPSTGLRPPVPGQIASIRYDPANPSNSILVAGSWSRPSAEAPKAATQGKREADDS